MKSLAIADQLGQRSPSISMCRLFSTLTVTILFILLLGPPVEAATLYVSPSGSHTPPFTNWLTAATNIQAAIDVAADGDTVLVTNGFYDTGGVVVHGAMTNRIAITNAINVSSVNGPEFSFIVGKGPPGDTAVRCAYVGDGARLEGFTLTNGHTLSSGDRSTERSGGGVLCETNAVVSRCTISGNTARVDGGGTYGGVIRDCIIEGNTAIYGAGTYGSTVQSSTIVGNAALSYGGGVMRGVVSNSIIAGNTALSGRRGGGGIAASLAQNCAIFSNQAGTGGGALISTTRSCTITGNSASRGGGGTYGGVVQNSIVYHNSVIDSGGNYFTNNYWAGTLFEYTCTLPLPSSGVGNITNAPQFVDASVSDYHLVPTSPCIDAGSNQAWMVGATDLDGNSRIVNEHVDMGAHEFLSAADAVELLISVVNGSSLKKKRPLLATLEAALASIERDNSVSAINQLRAFRNKVFAQVYPIDPDLATALIEGADDAIEALGGEAFSNWDTLALQSRI